MHVVGFLRTPQILTSAAPQRRITGSATDVQRVSDGLASCASVGGGALQLR